MQLMIKYLQDNKISKNGEFKSPQQNFILQIKRVKSIISQFLKH